MKARSTVWLACVVALALANALAQDPARGATSEGARWKVSRFSDVAVCGRLNESSGVASYPFIFMLDMRVADSKDPAVRSAVGAVQRLLRRIKYTGTSSDLLTVDGTFGTHTKHAVKAFQRDYNLAIDGKVGPKTWTALAREACAYAQPLDSSNDHEINAALLTGAQAERASRLSPLRAVADPSPDVCGFPDSMTSRYCGRTWAAPDGDEVGAHLEYFGTADGAVSALHEWKTKNLLHPGFWEEVVTSTPTLFIAADRREDGSVRVEGFQVDRRILIRPACFRRDGNVAAATTCVERLIAAQKPNADTVIDALI